MSRHIPAMRAISCGCGAPMRSNLTPARRSMKGTRPSFLRSTSVTLTPVQPARPVRPLRWMYVSGSLGGSLCAGVCVYVQV